MQSAELRLVPTLYKSVKSPPLRYPQLLSRTMAENPSQDATSEQLQNLHLDEVTGEKLSKSELKRRQKQREQEQKKKDKAAAAPSFKPAASKKVSAEEEESNLTPNV